MQHTEIEAALDKVTEAARTTSKPAGSPPSYYWNPKTNEGRIVYQYNPLTFIGKVRVIEGSKIEIASLKITKDDITRLASHWNTVEVTRAEFLQQIKVDPSLIASGLNDLQKLASAALPSVNFTLT